MRLAIFGVVAAICGIVLAPNVHSASAATDAPPIGVVRVAALGRAHAAADLVWLKTVQLMGTGTYAAAHFPGLERWIDLATTLDPRFESPYFFGAVMLSTVPDEKRLEDVDRLLDRGQRALPNSFTIPMNRGFIAYFGRGDAMKGAEHYRDASRRPDAPKYLEAFARTLETQATTCTHMIDRLKALAKEATKDQAEAMFKERQHIILNCVKKRLVQAETKARLTLQKSDITVDMLVELGLIERRELEFRPAGECWVLKGALVTLEPCQPTP